MSFTKRTLTLFVFFIFLHSGQSAPAQEQKSDATLEETISWLKAALGGPLYADRWKGTTKLVAFSIKDCALAYTYDINVDSPPAGRHVHKRDTYNLLLKDVDYSSGAVTAANDGNPIYFHTSDPKMTLYKVAFRTSGRADKVRFKVIVEEKGQWQNNANFEQSNFEVVLKNEEMAHRVLSALKHAIKLCGGKADPF